GVVNPKGLVEITDHWFFGINMLARLHRINADARVPRVVGGHHDGVDVLSFDHFSVVAVNIRAFQLGLFLRPVTALVEHVAGRRHDDIVCPRVLVDAFQVVFSYAEANADNGDGDAVVGADDTPGRGGAALSVNRRFEEVAGGNDRRSSGRLLDEFP